MGLFAKFSLSKLRAALQRKDWKEVEKRQNKMGIQVFLARRGIDYNKPVAVVKANASQPLVGSLLLTKNQQSFSGLHTDSVKE